MAAEQDEHAHMMRAALRQANPSAAVRTPVNLGNWRKLACSRVCVCAQAQYALERQEIPIG